MTKVKDSFFRTNMLSVVMKNLGTGVLISRTVDELLWGYEDPLLVRLSALNSDVDKVFGLMYKVWMLNTASVKNMQ